MDWEGQELCVTAFETALCVLQCKMMSLLTWINSFCVIL